MASILAYTSPATGHAFPLVPGLLALRARGHSVQLRTAPGLVETIGAAGLEVGALDSRVGAVAVDDHAAGGRRERLVRGFEALLARGEAEIEDLERAIVEQRPELLLIDCNAYGAAVAAAASGLPWATTLPSLLPLPGRGIPAYGLGMRPRRGPLARVRDRLLWALIVRLYGEAMLPRLNELRGGVGLPALSDPTQQMHTPDRLLVLTGEPLEYPRPDLPPHVRFVGPQCWDPPAPAPQWLQEPGDPWVLVTCSTEYQGDEALAAAAIEGLRDEPVRVVVTLADAYGASLPSAANARLERFVPHGPVLERAAAVVCPGGMGITQKALVAGVPLVAVPFGRDQPEVSRRIVECGAGVRLPSRRLSPQRLRAAVREAMALPREPRPGFGSGDEADRFATAAEELIGLGEAQRSRPASSTRERTPSLA
jgi:MGT family glycosyltransferase